MADEYFTRREIILFIDEGKQKKELITNEGSYGVEAIFINRDNCIKAKRVYQERICFYERGNEDKKTRKEIFIQFTPLKDRKNAYEFKISFHASRFKGLGELLSFYNGISPSSASWKSLLYDSFFSEVHLKCDFENVELKFFMKHLVYKYPRCSHVLNNIFEGGIMARTYYVNKSLYFYEKGKIVRMEYRLKGRKKILAELGFSNFSDIWDEGREWDISDLILFKNISFKDSFAPLAKVKNWAKPFLFEFNKNLNQEELEEIEGVTDIVKSYNCFHAQKTVINKRMKKNFKKELEDHFQEIEFDLVSCFKKEKECFYKNFNGDYMSERRMIRKKKKETAQDVEVIEESGNVGQNVIILPDTLSDKERQYIIARVVHGHSHNTIAATMSMSKTTSMKLARKLQNHIANARADWIRRLIEEENFNIEIILKRKLEMYSQANALIDKKLKNGDLEKVNFKDLVKIAKQQEDEICDIVKNSSYRVQKDPLNINMDEEGYEDFNDEV